MCILEICMKFLEEGERRTEGSHFSGEFGPEGVVLDDELSFCLALFLFSVGKVASVVFETLDGELLFAQLVFSVHPGGLSLEELPLESSM